MFPAYLQRHNQCQLRTVFQKANLDSRSSQLDDNLTSDVTSFTSKGSASSSITSSIYFSSASSARLRIISRSSNSIARILCLIAVSRHLCFIFVLIPSLSPHHTSLKSRAGVSPPILFCALV